MLPCNHIRHWSGVNSGKRECKEIVKKGGGPNQRIGDRLQRAQQSRLHQVPPNRLLKAFFAFKNTLNVPFAMENADHMNHIVVHDIIDPDSSNPVTGHERSFRSLGSSER